MRKGFTLVELLIVVIIIGLLASIGIVQYGKVVEKGRSAEAYSVLADIAASESAYYVENNEYADTFPELDRYSSAPVSDNFTYTLGTTYGKATSTKGGPAYCMNFSGSKITCP